ncbi:MAG: tetratricopeptide repeat protein [Pseudomonadota bacterium]
MLKQITGLISVCKEFALSTGMICLAVLFFLANSSCSGGSRPASGEDLPAIHEEVSDASALEPADAACSYFYFLWGASAEEEEKYEEAMEAYEKALVCDANSDYVRRKLAVLLINMGKKEQAIVMLEQMVVTDPENMETRILLANLFSSMGRVEEAKKVYGDILTLHPDDTHALLMMGALHARDREYEKAQEMLEKLVKVDDKSYSGYSYLAKLYRELRYFDKSIEAYEKALSLNWSTMLAYEAVELYEYRQRYGEAAALYRRLLEEDEANTKIRGRLARIYLEMGKVEAALDELEELRDYADDPAMVDLAIGRVLLNEKKFPEAITLFEKMMGEPENRDVARSMLALTYYEAGEKDKAKKILREVPASSKDYENSVLMLVQILLDENDKERAVSVLQNVMTNEETRHPSFYYLLAGIMREEGKVAEGKGIFEEALRVFGDDSKVWFEYGLYLERIGEQEEALAKMQQVLAIDPDDAYALNYVGYTWADRGVNLEKALEYVKKAVELKPEDGFVRDSLGWVYFKMGNYDAAVRELEAAVAMQPEDPTMQEHLGDAYQKAGQLEKAVGAYERALSLYKDDMQKAHALAEIQALKSRIKDTKE